MEGSPNSATKVDLKPGAIIAKRYEIRNRIGSGGMGMVYRVVDRELNDEEVALKLLHPHLAQDENVFRRFRNEVLVARSLSHPNIVRTHDIGRTEEGVSYISMEFIEGVSLKEHLSVDGDPDDTATARKRALPFEDAIGIFCQILSGIAYAHGKDVIHRDLKPANVLFSSAGEVKLADFGTARIMGMDTSITRTGQVIGTPDYMSPEQIRGERLDAACDIYSLGIIGWELVTGKRPFVADSPVAVAFKHLNEPLPAFASADSGIPKWYEEVVLKAAEKKREDRFADAREMALAVFEHAPEMSVQSGYFPVDGTNFFQNSGGTAGTSTPTTSGNEASSKFELGKTKGGATGGWTLDYTEFEQTAIQQEAPAEEQSWSIDEPAAQEKKKSSPFWSLLKFASGVVIVCFLALCVGVRVHHGLHDSVKEVLLSRGGSPELLASVLGVNLETPSRTAAPAPLEPESDEQRQALRDELIGLSDGELPRAVSEASPEPSVEATAAPQATAAEPKAVAQAAESPVPASTEASTGAESASASEPSAGEAKPADTPVQTAAAAQDTPAVEPTPEPEPSVAPTPEPTPPLVKKGTLLLRYGKNPVTADPVSVDKLRSVRWSSAVTGLDTASPSYSVRQLKRDVVLNVFDPNTSKVIAKIKPGSVDTAKSPDEPTTISGNLGALRRADPAAGSYRVDVVHDGEVLASQNISLYKARVSFSTPQGASGSTGGKVAIVRGPSYIPPGQPSNPNRRPQADATTAVQERAPSPTPQAVPQATAVSQPAPSPAATGARLERIPVRESYPKGKPYSPGVGQTYPSGGTGLPPARRPAGQSAPISPANVSSLDMPSTSPGAEGYGRGPSVTQPAEIPEFKESYGGKLRLKAGKDAAVEERAMILDLAFRGAAITGTATIAGYPPFRVSGKVFARGLELRLQNSQEQIRLTSGPRGRTLRGGYVFGGKNWRGSWKVTRTR